MKINSSMKRLLQNHAIENIDSIPPSHSYPIWERKDSTGRSYWGVSHFWNLDQYPNSLDQDLSQLEWDGNEIHLVSETANEVPEILRTAIGIIKAWKMSLQSEYRNTPFYLFASFDNGDFLVLDEGQSPIQSVTLRFWADRDTNTVINFSHFDEWEQPALVEQCNF